MTELIITEKPSSAEKVAYALADGRPLRKKTKYVSYFELSHGNKRLVVASAVGHLYTLAEVKKNGWTYPVFDMGWKPGYQVSKDMKHTKEYIDTLSALSKQARSFTIACDYDIEGEVIGLNVIRFACRQKDAFRMKFSTLTKEDLIEAYQEKKAHLDWGQAYAGETRHKLDWLYGINLSRALTASVKAAGSFKIMSAGRVQGPTLKLLVDREREIEAFRPEPYWEIGLWGTYKKENVEAWHVAEKIFDRKKVEEILKKIHKEKEARVKEVKRARREQAPPFPFDLTSLQTESYNVFKITPKETLAIAQTLYLAGVTSYPRTSSQQLDPKIGFAKILKALQKQPVYEKLCASLLEQKELKPNNGKKTDPAHPAIFPTGLAPSGLKPKEQKVYDLIVKRFLATFAKPALRETMEVALDVKGELFLTKGTRTLEANWHVYYRPYLQLEEITLPDMKEGEIVAVRKIDKVDKETQPPKRYTQASIIKELERRNLGTKATRADILDRLFQRGYIEGVQIKATKLGIETVLILEKYAPLIVDEKLTAHFEEDMDKIREGQEKQEKVLEEARRFLTGLLADFKKKEKTIGKDIIQSLQETREEQNYIGACPACKEGKLMIKFGKFGKFIACDKYPGCTATYKLPGSGLIKNSDKSCEHCQYPMVLVIRKGKRPQDLCINPDCKSKTSAEERKEIAKFEQGKIEKQCPKCSKPLVVRKSMYGSFLGCSGYPKCRHTEKLEGAAK